MKNKPFATILFVAIVSAACEPVTPSPPNIIPEQPLATPTRFQLPINDQIINRDYCQLPAVHLPFSDAQSLSEDEITERLMDLLLAYFAAPGAPGYCRVDDYRIDKVSYDEHAPYSQLEPKGDFMRTVQFSIRLVQVPNMWMSWTGEVDQQNWLHTWNNVAVLRNPDSYTMKFAYP